MTTPQPGRGGTGPSPARPGSRGELLPRVLSALVMAALAIGTAWVGGIVFDLFWLVAAVLVLSEWCKLVGLTRRELTITVGSFAMMAANEGVGGADMTFAIVALAIGAGLIFAIAEVGERILAMTGIVYASVLAVAVPILRHSTPDGFPIMIWLFAVVWGTDTMAFFGGRALGGPKLAPRLSPSKTWSGFAVGVVSGALLGLPVAPRSDCPLCVVAAGLAGGALAQAGDLLESSLKRRFGAKDAGSIIPGHGGVMDRLDGFIAASVFAAAVGLWRFGPEGAGAGLLKW